MFRSAHLGAATASDAARLEALGVKFLVDLRHREERERAPNGWAPARVLVRDSDPSLAPEPPLQPPAAGPYTPETGRSLMRTTYARIPYDPRTIALFGDLFHALAEEGGPMIVHCSVGKDRTGIACALLLDTLGVDRATILQDFLATNAFLDHAERARLLRAELEPMHGPLSDEQIAPVIGVDAEYLNESFATIERASGSVAAYVERTLGVAPATQARLRALLRAGR
jgi:protein-tyrosine phosphatase